MRREVNISTRSKKAKMVDIELFGNIDKAEFIESRELLKRAHKIRYIATDFEYSGYDIYEEISTGYLYATNL